MGTLTVEPLDATLGARVSGVRLAQLDEAGFAVIEAAFHDHAVLVFPGQHLTDAEQMAFAARFGPLSIRAQPFSNEKDDGSLRDRDDPLMQLFRGNEGWHTDSSFQPVSAKLSMLSARKVPRDGGETEWADMRAAYAALTAELRARIESLTAFHSLYHSQSTVGQAGGSTASALRTLHEQRRAPDDAAGDVNAGYAQDADETPPLRPLVKVHPVTGRPALFIGRHAYGIPGMEADESKALLAELVDFACRAPRVYQHAWRVGDLVMWDNRCVLHRARPWDTSEPRSMFHTRVAGDPETEIALNKAAA